MSLRQNKKIDYPIKKDGYISSRLLKEMIYVFLETNNDCGDIDKKARNIIQRFKSFLMKNNLSNKIHRLGVRGKEQFEIIEFNNWIIKSKGIEKKYQIEE